MRELRALQAELRTAYRLTNNKKLAIRRFLYRRGYRGPMPWVPVKPLVIELMPRLLVHERETESENGQPARTPQMRGMRKNDHPRRDLVSLVQSG